MEPGGGLAQGGGALFDGGVGPTPTSQPIHEERAGDLSAPEVCANRRGLLHLAMIDLACGLTRPSPSLETAHAVCAIKRKPHESAEGKASMVGSRVPAAPR